MSVACKGRPLRVGVVGPSSVHRILVSVSSFAMFTATALPMQ